MRVSLDGGQTYVEAPEGEEYTHTFLKLNDLFYDAECIEGEEDWTQLPVFQRPDQLCEKCHRIVAEYSHQSGELCEDCWQNVNE